MKQVKNNIKVFLSQLILASKNLDPYNNIFIFSDQRGGSTWLMEIMNQIPKTAVLWEPLHEYRGVVSPSLNFAWRQYIPESETWEAAQEDLSQILKGNKLNPWVVGRTPFRNYISCDKLVVKFVRGNALFPWFINHMPLKRKPILQFRHPIPVSLSQMKAFKDDKSFESHYQEEYFTLRPHPYNDFFTQHNDFLKTLKTKLEIHVARWCMYNKPALELDPDDRFVKVNYENLLLNSKKVIREIFQGLKAEIPEGIYQQVFQPSKTDFKRDLGQTPQQQVEKWLPNVTRDDLKRVERILNYFEIEEYVAESPYPVTQEGMITKVLK